MQYIVSFCSTWLGENISKKVIKVPVLKLEEFIAG